MLIVNHKVKQRSFFNDALHKVGAISLFILIAVGLSSGVKAQAPAAPSYAQSLPAVTATDLLNAMRVAISQNDYQISFVSSTAGRLNGSFRYRHINYDNRSFAQLHYLEGPARELILRDNMVSYYEQESAPFTITSSRIIEAFPNVVFNDFTALSQFYDYIPVGKARIADRGAQLVRLIAKDKDRYSYVIWIDEQTLLPLRIDLYDFNNTLLEQFKVIELSSTIDRPLFLAYLEKAADYPIVVPTEKNSTDDIDWSLLWTPSGFKSVAQSQLDYRESNIRSRMYSDGVFSFTISISPGNQELKPHSLQKGNQIIYITHIAGQEVLIIGDLPLETIKKIAQHIEIKTSR